ISRKSDIAFTTCSPGLRDDFIELLHSLGGKVNRVQTRKTKYSHNGERRVGRESYTVYFKTLFNPFRLSRKKERFFVTGLAHERIIYSIKPIGKRRATCIVVDNEDHSFLAGREYIVT